MSRLRAACNVHAPRSRDWHGSGVRFSVDAWDPDFGTSADPDGMAGSAGAASRDAGLPASSARVDAGVEVPLGRWAPVPLCSGPTPRALVLVDGVRRLDARVWIEESDGQVAMGLCASYAAGAVRCEAGGARVVQVEPRRALVTASPSASAVPAGVVGDYEVVRTAPDPARPLAQVLTAALQRRLSDLELAVAVAARAPAVAGDEVLVVDGPLQGRTHLAFALGYVKSHRTEYLPADLQRVVAALAPGERTPAFLVGTTWDRHTWYLRLPGPAGGPWSGVVRVECAADLGMDRVVELARLSQRVLPPLASVAYKDPRAPQNLHPIGGLEKLLRHRLGDQRVAATALRRAAAAA